jgi:hypothetical protein
MSATPRNVFNLGSLRQHLRDLESGKISLKDAYEHTDDVLDTALAILKRRSAARARHVRSVFPEEAKEG